MSLDMTMGRREAALDSAEQVETAPAARLWLQDLLVMSATAVGVLLSSLLGVLLFLR